MKALKKILRFVSWCAIGTFGLALLLYLVAAGINWRDTPPSSAALELEEIIANRPPLADADNAFVYLLGFAAAEEQDPEVIGANRLRWLEAFGPDTDAGGDPLPSTLEFMEQGTVGQRLRDACKEADRAGCAREFDSIAAKWAPTTLDTLALRRYEALLTRPGWRELAPVDISSPLPHFAQAMHAQRLTFLRLAQSAPRADSASIKLALSSDIAFWRRTQREADNLISKMIAVAALRQHFYYSALVFRRLPPDQVASAVPAEWSREFGAEDRSMKRAMAGELVFTAKLLRQFKVGKSPASDEWAADTWPWNSLGPAAMKFARPLFQLQDQTNYFAERNLEYARRFEVPMSEYEAVAESMRDESGPRDFPTRVFNITGDLLLSLSDGRIESEYALRVASVEGMRRAALLTAELRDRGVSPSRVAEELTVAKLRDPYSNKPFTWDAEHGSVVFEGPEIHHWHRQEFFY